MVEADPVRLRATFAAVLTALRRELITSMTLAVRERPADLDGRPAAWIAIADPDRIDAVLASRRSRARSVR